MSEYKIRKATEEDIPFLAYVVIKAEKGNTDKLGFSTLFNLSEEDVYKLIVAMFEEGIDGCEFSVSSFLITEYNGEPIAAFGGWIEAFNGNKPSKILKSNLINYTFEVENLLFFKEKAHLIRELSIEREPLTFQMEYAYISENHRGLRLGVLDKLIEKLEENALSMYPSLKKIQGHLFKSNDLSMFMLRKNGFKLIKKYKSNNPDVLNFLPSNEKHLVEKIIKTQYNGEK